MRGWGGKQGVGRDIADTRGDIDSVGVVIACDSSVQNLSSTRNSAVTGLSFSGTVVKS
jgi:hypothetical protein